MPRSASGRIHQATLVRGAHPTWGGLPYFDSSPVLKVGCASPPPTGRAPILRLAPLPEALSDTPGCTSPPPGPGSKKISDGGHPRVPVATSEPRLEGFLNGGHPRVPVATSGPARRIYPGPRAPPGALVAPGGIFLCGSPPPGALVAQCPGGGACPADASLGPWAVGLPSRRLGCVASESCWVLAFPVALARFFAVGCAEYIALRFAVGSPGLAPRSGYTRRRLGQARPPWPLGRGDRGLLAPGAAAPRGGYPAGRPVGFASRSPVAGGELVPPRAAEWLHPQAGWSGGRRHLRGRSEDFQQ